jgi:CubicO group peptidase (beta-lactamase class C family)
VFTSTLVLQLVDDGLLDLDAPVRSILPNFRLRDPKAEAAVTTRHLLTHTAGFEGDAFVDTGDGDDAVARYLEIVAELPQLFAPGTTMSYCNAGYVVLGRLVEVLRGTTWARALQDRIATPLELTSLRTDLESANPRALAPAGSTLVLSLADLVAFAAAHLAGGLAPSGFRVLSVDTARALQALSWPKPWAPDSGRALGWDIYGGPTQGFGHDGRTGRHSAMLRVLPVSGRIVAMAANGGDDVGLRASLDRMLLGPTAIPERRESDPTRLLGRYAGPTAEYSVYRDADGRLWVDRSPGPADVPNAPNTSHEVASHGDDALVELLPLTGNPAVYRFEGDAGDGRAAFLRVGTRLIARARDRTS